jgi:hypothetical protein
MRAQRARAWQGRIRPQQAVESYERESAVMDFVVSAEEPSLHEPHVGVEPILRADACRCVSPGSGQDEVGLTNHAIEVEDQGRVAPGRVRGRRFGIGCSGEPSTGPGKKNRNPPIAAGGPALMCGIGSCSGHGRPVRPSSSSSCSLRAGVQSPAPSTPPAAPAVTPKNRRRETFDRNTRGPARDRFSKARDIVASFVVGTTCDRRAGTCACPVALSTELRHGTPSDAP